MDFEDLLSKKGLTTNKDSKEEEKPVVPAVEVLKEADPEEGFDVVEVSDLDGWEVRNINTFWLMNS